MDVSQMSDNEIARGIEEDVAVLAALTKYQNFLASGRGLPKHDSARIQLMESNIKISLNLRAEIDKLMAEQERRISK